MLRKLCIAAVLLTGCGPGPDPEPVLPPAEPPVDPPTEPPSDPPVDPPVDPPPVAYVPVRAKTFSALPWAQGQAFLDRVAAIAEEAALVDWGVGPEVLDGWVIRVYDRDNLPPEVAAVWPAGAGALTWAGWRQIWIATDATGLSGCADILPINHEVAHAVLFELGDPTWYRHDTEQFNAAGERWRYDMRCE